MRRNQAIYPTRSLTQEIEREMDRILEECDKDVLEMEIEKHANRVRTLLRHPLFDYASPERQDKITVIFVKIQSKMEWTYQDE